MPSNYIPAAVLMVTGENSFHTKLSQILVAKNKFYPLPMPYPLINNSSQYITKIEAKVS